MYLLQKLVGALATPLLLPLMIAAVAGILRLRGRARPVRYLLTAAATIAYLACTNIVGNGLIGVLERRYPPLNDAQVPAAAACVVVLGSGYDPHRQGSTVAALDADGLARIIEAVRISRQLTSPRLVLSGGAPLAAHAPARGYAKLARELGVGEQSLVVLDRALDTAEEAREIAALLGRDERCILVTSAYHMPRAMQRMQQAGMRPIAAPTGQLAGASRVLSWDAWYPGAAGLRKSERAMHEYVGLLALAAGIG